MTGARPIVFADDLVQISCPTAALRMVPVNSSDLLHSRFCSSIDLWIAYNSDVAESFQGRQLSVKLKHWLTRQVSAELTSR